MGTNYEPPDEEMNTGELIKILKTNPRVISLSEVKQRRTKKVKAAERRAAEEAERAARAARAERRAVETEERRQKMK